MDEIFTLANKKGMSIICASVGAGLVDVSVPDRSGLSESILIRPKKYSQYYRASGSFGKTIGRTAGRISDAEFMLDDEVYKIETGDDRPYALHGGKEALAYKTFDVRRNRSDDSSSLIFTYLSPDGEGGYPGNLSVTVTYTLYDSTNRLTIRHQAYTDRNTLCNLTNHAYYNLSGNAKRNVLRQVLFLGASYVGIVDKNTIATELIKVPKAFDFRTPHAIGEYIEEPEVQKNTLGYDHPYMLDHDMPGKPVASLYDSESGRFMQVMTSYESCVLYTANHPAEYIIQNGKELSKYDACCLEMQHFPNTINSPFLPEKRDIIYPSSPYDNYIDLLFSVK